MAEVSTAEILQDRLTEYGLVRTLARQDISPDLVRRVSIEEAGQLLQRGMLYPGSTHATAVKVKKAKKAKKASKKASYHGRPAKKSSKKQPVKAVSKSGGIGKRQVRPNYWKRIKRELHILVCTDDRKYQTLRRHIGKESRTTQAAIVSTISIGIASQIGFAATVIGPFVSLGLMALLELGTNAWCAEQSG
jgi:hypothetical protein